MAIEPGGEIHAYEIEHAPGIRLCVGVHRGEARPTLWIEGMDRAPDGGVIHRRVVLASFHGPKEAGLAAYFLNDMVEQINQAILHHRQGPHE